MATNINETQKGLVKETQSENYEEKKTTESTSYEIGVGANAAIVGCEFNMGFEYVEDSKTEVKPVENVKPSEPEKEQNK